MVRNVEAQHLAFFSELLTTVKLRKIRDFNCKRRTRILPHAHSTKEVKLPDGLVTLDIDHRIHGLVTARQKSAPCVTQRIKSACAHERLDRSLIANHLRNLVQEVLEGSELALLMTRLDDRVDNVRTNILNSIQTKANVLTIRSKGAHRSIDIRRKNSNSHVATLCQVERTSILIVLRRGQKGGHVLSGIVCFEVGSPVRHQTVGCRVGFVECVGREGNDYIPQSLD